MWEFLQSSIVPVIIVVLLYKFFGSSADSGPPPTHFAMEIIENAHAIKRDKSKKKISEIFAENDLIALYFSAHWCPPCRMFTPELADVYAQLKKEGKKFEVIFVSSDRDEESMMSYLTEAHGDWFAIEFDSPTVKQVKEHFQIRGIPSLVVLRKDGTVVSTEARNEVVSQGAACWDKWSA